MLRVAVFDGEDQVAYEVTDKPVVIEARSGVETGTVWLLSIEIGEWNGLPRIVSVTTQDAEPVAVKRGKDN